MMTKKEISIALLEWLDYRISTENYCDCPTDPEWLREVFAAGAEWKKKLILEKLRGLYDTYGLYDDLQDIITELKGENNET